MNRLVLLDVGTDEFRFWFFQFGSGSNRGNQNFQDVRIHPISRWVISSSYTARRNWCYRCGQDREGEKKWLLQDAIVYLVALASWMRRALSDEEGARSEGHALCARHCQRQLWPRGTGLGRTRRRLAAGRQTRRWLQLVCVDCGLA